MLKGVDPLVTPALLEVLAAMGHGDELALVDRNFPAASTAQRLICIPGSDLPAVASAILSLLPLDQFVESPLAGMARDDRPEEVPPVQQVVLAIASASSGRPLRLDRLAREVFYGRARTCFAVVSTGEARLFGCVILRKGIIGSEDDALHSLEVVESR